MLPFKDYSGEFIENKSGDRIQILAFVGKDKNRPSRWFYICPYCGATHTATIAYIKNNNRCPQCPRALRKTHEEYCVELQSKNPFVRVAEKYKGDAIKINHICPVCQRDDWSVSPSNVLSGVSCCNTCNASIHNSFFSEVAQQYLYKRGVAIPEYDIGYKALSFFDLYIPRDNLLIEIQSEYHDDNSSISKDAQKKDFAIQEGYNVEYVDNRTVNVFDFITRFCPDATKEDVVANVDLRLIKREPIVKLDVNHNLVAVYYGGLAEIQSLHGYPMGSISRACSGKNYKSKHFSHGYLWYKKEDYESMSSDAIQVVTEKQMHNFYLKNNMYKYIAQKNDEVVVADSAQEMSKFIKSDPSLIIACINGRRNHTNGYSITRTLREDVYNR